MRVQLPGLRPVAGTAGGLSSAASTASLTFGSTYDTVTSAPQTVTLTNTGGEPLSVGSISATGDYAATTNCSSTVAAGQSCQVNVTFTPLVVGADNGTLSIVNGADTKSVTLAGTGVGEVVAHGSSRTWSDGSYAASCNGYLNPATGFAYAGATGSGVYRIAPAGMPFDVYCDMVGNGEGWTLLMKQAAGDGTTLEGDTGYWTNGTTLNDNSGSLNTGDGNFVSQAFRTLTTTSYRLTTPVESTAQFQTTGAMTAVVAFGNGNRTLYSDDVGASGTVTDPNWFIHATTYPTGITITTSRFGFNFAEYVAPYSGSVACSARWGWSSNENPQGNQPGSHDACGGLGAYGSTYGAAYGMGNRNAWQPGTLYLWAK
jgi:hypothetical protein